MEQHGTNARREAEEPAAADAVRARAEAARSVLLADAEAERSVKPAEAATSRRLAEAEAARTALLADAEAERAVRIARAEAEAAHETGAARAEARAPWLRVHAGAGLDGATTLRALTAGQVAENLPHIDSVTVSPDVLTGLLARLGAETGR